VEIRIAIRRSQARLPCDAVLFNGVRVPRLANQGGGKRPSAYRAFRLRSIDRKLANRLELIAAPVDLSWCCVFSHEAGSFVWEQLFDLQYKWQAWLEIGADSRAGQIMDHDVAFGRLWNHANMPGTTCGNFSAEESFLQNLYKSTDTKTPFIIAPYVNDIITCLERINVHVNGSLPSNNSTKRSPIDSLSQDLGWEYMALETRDSETQ
jgi:hypothetical protein